MSTKCHKRTTPQDNDSDMALPLGGPDGSAAMAYANQLD